MATKTFYGGVTETNSLYGNSPADKSTYFEWLIFKDALGQPTTPTGGSWSFDTNTGTAPTGWLNSPPSSVNNLLWVSVAIVDSRNPTVLTWSSPGLMASPSGGASGVAVSASNSLQNNGTVSFANSNGVTFGLSNGVMTATVATDYIAGNQTSNLQYVSNTSNITSNAVNVSQTTLFQQTSNTSNITSNAFPSANTTNFAGTGTTFAGTNATATLNVNSAGVALSLSAAAGGGGGGGIAAAAGTQTAATGTINFVNSNGITFGMSNSSQITASYTVPTQSVQTQASGSIAGAGFSSTTTAGTAVVATHNSAGLSMGVPAFLTTARASNDAVGLNTALTANGVSWTVNSSGLSLNVPAFLTTAAQSNHSHNFATTTTNGSQIVVGTANSAGATIGVPAFITTYAAQTNQTVASGNIAGVGTTFAGTNVSGSMTLNSNGLNLALSAPTPGGGGAINVSAGTTSGNLQTIQFANSNGVSFGLNGSTITASAAGGGGGVNLAAGTQTAGTGTVNFANSNNITFGMSGSNQITASFSQSVQTQPSGNIAGVGTTYAGTDIAATIGLNSNGLALSLSQSAGTDVWVATGANTIAGTNTTGSWTHDSYIVSGAGVASVGVSGGTLIVSVPAGGGAGFAAGVSTDAVGTTGTVSNQIVFFEGANITLSQSINGNSASVSIVGAAGGGGGGYTYTRWPSPGQNISSITSAALTAYNGSLIIGAELAGVNISATGIANVFGHSVQSTFNTLQNGSLSLRIGIYSRTNDTQLTLLTSGSTSFAMSWSSSTTTGVVGMRELYVPMNVNMPVGEYFIARNMSYTGDNASAATAHTVSFFGVPMQTNVSNVADGFGVATNASNAAFIPFQGVYSTTTNAMPNSIGLAQVTMSGSAVAAGNFFREYH